MGFCAGQKDSYTQSSKSPSPYTEDLDIVVDIVLNGDLHALSLSWNIHIWHTILPLSDQIPRVANVFSSLFWYNNSYMKSLSLSSPHLIVMAGEPGAGKTYFAQQFADTFSAPLLSSHYFDAYEQDYTTVSQSMLQLLREVIKTDRTIICDGLASRRVERDALAKFAKKNGYKILFIWVQTDPDTAKRRALKVSSSSTYESNLRRFSPPHESEPFIVISGKHTYATQAKTVLRHLAQLSRPDKIAVEERAHTPPRARQSRTTLQRG